MGIVQLYSPKCSSTNTHTSLVRLLHVRSEYNMMIVMPTWDSDLVIACRMKQ